MEIKKYKIYYLRFTRVTFILIAFILTISSCRQETSTNKLSSKSCLVVPFYLKAAFICEGEPFIIGWDHTEIPVYADKYLSQGKMSRMSLNPVNGNFSEFAINYPSLLPKNTTLSTSITQLKPNSNLFILNSEFTYFDSAYDGYPYTKLYLTDKNISLQREFKLSDSSIIVNDVKQMADGRYAVACTKGTTKQISCYNNNLTLDWIRTVEFGSFPKDFDNTGILVTSEYIYVLQVSRYITKNYSIYQYDYDGRKLSTYELNSQTNKFGAGQLIESSNGFYIIGTKYLPEKSDFDISVSIMSPANKLLSEHGLNLMDYLPDWNTATQNIANTYFSSATSWAIKTTTGYAFTMYYPDYKNNSCMALVMLNDQMKVESVKEITKMVGGNYDPNHINNLFTDGNRFYIIWSHPPYNYFYVLDMEGNLINE